MPEQKKQPFILVIVFITLLAIAFLLVLAIFKKPPAVNPYTELPLVQNNTEPASEPLDANIVSLPAPKMSINDIILRARYWGPVYESWSGKQAADFTLPDIAGKQHKLSDYRGKNVVIVFWASWCGPCKTEIPNLIALRNTVGPDNLAILAISNEPLQTVINFASATKMNYTVLVDNGTLPKPFDRINYIPCNFFIRPDGRIKLAAAGVMSLGEIKAVLNAD